MSRLTVKVDDKKCIESGIRYLPKDSTMTAFETLNKLGELEDLEEQGRLIVRKHERCEYCSDGETLKGQRIMASNYGWQDINYCPNCGAKMEGSKW